ncbi:hypothetical protein [Cupriavidus sp. MP-37]|uniref:hypothetical protein n=1 Tax=Cupriavidus sp. MP-37 TaxID=2884455 RepID=UPI001D0B5F2C|nr:hypothetical protein [Cupriavidus sp. MP-37]UDM49168.1 hypothetical protein LIN44_11055 [Cupriavidus sp. MP-37]
MTQRLNDFQQSPELSRMLMELLEPAGRRLAHGAGSSDKACWPDKANPSHAMKRSGRRSSPR